MKNWHCYRHGLTRTKLYFVWTNMIQRCTNPKTKGYKHYGGRGIAVCPEWRDASTFFRWAQASGYRAGVLLDRIDNDGGYHPKNCRWASRAVSNQNRRRLNALNTSGYRGVSHVDWGSKPWKVQVYVEGHNIYLGCYSDITEAAYEYDAYVIAEGREHTLNFPRGPI